MLPLLCCIAPCLFAMMKVDLEAKEDGTKHTNADNFAALFKHFSGTGIGKKNDEENQGVDNENATLLDRNNKPNNNENGEKDVETTKDVIKEIVSTFD